MAEPAVEREVSAHEGGTRPPSARDEDALAEPIAGDLRKRHDEGRPVSGAREHMGAALRDEDQVPGAEDELGLPFDPHRHRAFRDHVKADATGVLMDGNRIRFGEFCAEVESRLELEGVENIAQEIRHDRAPPGRQMPNPPGRHRAPRKTSATRSRRAGRSSRSNQGRFCHQC